MDTAVISPQPGQTLVAIEDADRCRQRTDPWLLQGQAAIRDDVGEAKYDLAATVNERAAENLQATARNDAITQANFAAAAAGASAIERSINAQVVHGIDVSQQAHAQTQHAICDLRYETQTTARDGFERMGVFERNMVERTGNLELRLTKELCQLRAESAEQHCEIKELIRCEAAKSRDQVIDYRMQDLRDVNQRLQFKLDSLGRP